MYYFSNALEQKQNTAFMRYFEIYDVEMNEETMILKIVKDSPRSRMGKKIVVHIRFRTVERMHEYFTKEWFASTEKHINAEIAAKKARQEARASFVNPFKMGQIFYDSWGYDQTNVNFFQITEVGRKSVKIREIAQAVTREAGFMCEYVKPVPSEFIGDEMTKLISIDRSGKPHICSPFRGWLFEQKEENEEHYQSHYA